MYEENMYAENADNGMRFLSYVTASKSLVEQAASETGFAIRVLLSAVSDEIPIREGRVAVWTLEKRARDHGPFWQRFRELRDEEEKHGQG